MEENYEIMNKGASALGAFHMTWSSFDHVLEIGIARLCNLDFEHANLLLHGISFTRKISIAKSLLNSIDQKHEALPLLRDISEVAKRNTLVHSYLTLKTGEAIKFNRRDSADRFVHKVYEFTPNELYEHARKVSKTCLKIQKLLGIPDEDIKTYFDASRSMSSKSAKLP